MITENPNMVSRIWFIFSWGAKMPMIILPIAIPDKKTNKPILDVTCVKARKSIKYVVNIPSVPPSIPTTRAAAMKIATTSLSRVRNFIRSRYGSAVLFLTDNFMNADNIASPRTTISAWMPRCANSSAGRSNKRWSLSIQRPRKSDRYWYACSPVLDGYC